MTNTTAQYRTTYYVRTSTGAEAGEDRPALVVVAEYEDYTDGQYAVVDSTDVAEAVAEVERTAGPCDWRDPTDEEAIADEYGGETVLVGRPRLTATLRYYDEHDGVVGDDRGWTAVYSDGDEQRLAAGYGASEDEARAEVEAQGIEVR